MKAQRCGALTRNGKPCRNRVGDGAVRCRLHSAGSSTAWGRAPEEKSRESLLDWLPAGENLLHWLNVILDGAGAEREPRRAKEAGMSLTVEWLRLLREAYRRYRDYLNPDTVKGLFYMVRAFLENFRDLVQRRIKGEYTVDPYGLDEEFFDLCRPLFRLLYRGYWRVRTTGIENVPAEGAALIVANHSGVLPWDGAMINTAIWEEHPQPRYVRTMYLDWFPTLPFVNLLLTRTGQVLAHPENGDRLLRDQQLVAVFPEGIKGVGKLFRDRYRLARFGRGGFVKMALRARARIIPTAVVGAEEIHPMLASSRTMSRLTGMPFFPITPTFPWLGPLGVIPLPSNWHLHFCEPIRLDEMEPAEADNFVTVSRVAAQVRDTIQKTIRRLLKERGPAFGKRPPRKERKE